MHSPARTLRRQPGGLSSALRLLGSDRMALAAWCVLVFFLFLALFGPAIAPHNPIESNYDANGALVRLKPPSAQYWLGTTNLGQDVLSQVIAGARIPIMVGVISAVFVVFIGTNVGLIAGYFGRHVDDVLMRITDIAYGIPFIPFAIVLISITGIGITNIILAITLLLWRTSARVIRSQVLSLKERPFVLAAKLSGASDLRILYRYIAPHVLPLAMLYMAFGVAWGILAEASLGFLGFGDPEKISWGQMLYYAFRSGAIRIAWWWTVPPGLAIVLTVACFYLIGRTFESVANPRLRER
ncbi:MAG TPA: ABC transporter permease [Xanthobacteraceae bacterium]|nr:ABC transporter permease [Xanthobacteraceae bacterium]